MTEIIHFPTSPSIAIRKAEADQIELLDRIAFSHSLMVRAAKLVADDSLKHDAVTRHLLGCANDWLRMFEQTIDMIELEKAEVA